MLANSAGARNHYRIPVANANELSSQTARKPENSIETQSNARICLQSAQKLENIIENPLKTWIRYARKQLGAQKTISNLCWKHELTMLANSSKARQHSRTPIANTNSLCSQTARKPHNIIEFPWKREFAMLANNLEAKIHYKIRIEKTNSLCSQTAWRPDNTIEHSLTTRYARKQLESQSTL